MLPIIYFIISTLDSAIIEVVKLASIDIGSNSVRLLVADVEKGEIHPLIHERKVTRLASGLHHKGLIADMTLEGTIRAVREFSEIARSEGVVEVAMAGTSALRDASNASEAVRAIESASGHHLDIINGLQEAEIMSMGVFSGLRHLGRAIIFDIGGGSTELIAVNNRQVLKAITFPAGVVRMTEEPELADPPSISDIERLDRQSVMFSRLASEGLEDYIRHSDALIGTAGTASTLASLDMELDEYDWKRVQGHTLHLDRITELEALLQSTPLDIRRKIKGMEPERADLIIAGTRLTIRIMEALGFNQMTVSDFGLLEGLIVKISMETGEVEK
jgi:exopolyphosphatase/guanosine-5'-triphosphate,3'-diphosphate pyrophosphatase